MAFRNANLSHWTKFNSNASSDFVQLYEDYLDEQIKKSNERPSSRTFAPSSFRCDRRSWFRLRGVQPDVQKSADRALKFSAQIGTSCHEVIQTNLKDVLGDNWVSVEDYLTEHPIPYEYTLTSKGLETQVSIEDPPIRFACDGIIIWQNEYYLLEIKTAEYSSFCDLTDPKPSHLDQIKCYATLLNLDKVFVFYQDRMYGSIKVYEVKITKKDKQMVLGKFEKVLNAVKTNIAPEKLPMGDPFCSPSMCPYYKTCQLY